MTRREAMWQMSLTGNDGLAVIRHNHWGQSRATWDIVSIRRAKILIAQYGEKEIRIEAISSLEKQP